MRTRTRKAKYLQSAVILLFLAVCARTQQLPTPKLYRLSLPDKQLALQLTLPTVDFYIGQSPSELPSGSFIVLKDELSENGNYVLSLGQIRTKGEMPPFLWITLSPRSDAKTAADFRTVALEKVVRGARNVKLLEHNGIPLARYTTESQPTTYFFGPALIQKQVGPRSFQTLEAYLAKGDVCARLTFTASSLRTADEQQFFSLLDSLTLVDVSPPSTSIDFYHLARLNYMQQQYARAAELFETAVQLEQQRRMLDIRSWRDLITKTAETEAARGRFDAARHVLEYGIREEPANTNFLMNLARVYASMRDQERTLATLRSAFGSIRQAKGTKKGDLPDLDRDPAFKEMMKDKAFREAVKLIKK